MKNLSALSLLVALVAYSAPTLAHDPSLHKKDGTAPDCAKMKDMDMSKMDMNDPVTKAMQQQCRNHMKGDDEDSESHDHSMGNAPDPESKTTAPTDSAKR